MTDAFAKLRGKNLSNQELMRQASRILGARKARQSNANGHTTSRNGMTKSDALGVHPDQVAEFNEDARKAGFTAVHFDKDGFCHIPNFGSERKRYLRHRSESLGRKVYDKSEGY